MERIAVAFVTALRHYGLDVPVGSALRYHEALGVVGVEARDDVYWAGRATLVHDQESVPVYDAVFSAFWEQIVVVGSQMVVIDEQEMLLAIDTGDEDDIDGDEEAEESDLPVITLRYSPHELLGEKDFSEYDADELAEAQRLMQRLVVVGGRRPSRRRVPTRKTRGRPDLARTVRRALRAGGEPIERRFTTHGDRLRRVVFLLDVSGSMETYARWSSRTGDPRAERPPGTRR